MIYLVDCAIQRLDNRGQIIKNDTYVLQIVYQQREYGSLLLWPNGSYRSVSANEHLTTRDNLEGHLTQTTTIITDHYYCGLMAPIDLYQQMST